MLLVFGFLSSEGLAACVQTTEFVLEPRSGLVIEKKYPSGESVDYTYTDDGLVKTRTGGRGLTTTYIYHHERRTPLTVLYSDSTPNLTLGNGRFGELRSVSDGEGTRTIDYDANLRPLRETLDPIGSSRPNVEIGYRYDDPIWPGELNRTELKLGGALVSSTTINFDGLGRLDTLGFDAGNNTFLNIHYFYDPQRGWITDREVIGSGTEVRARRAENGVLETLTNQKANPAAFYSRFSGEYGDRLEREFLGVEGEKVGSAYHFDFDHDKRQRLTEALKRSGLTAGGGVTDVPVSADYAYDLAGNRTDADVGTNQFDYAVNNLNQVTAISSNGTNLATLLYDADGNLTNDGDFVYTYDAENRLIEALPLAPTTGVYRVTMRYDYRDRRYKKQVWRWSIYISDWLLDRTHHFVWEGSLLVREDIKRVDGSAIRSVDYTWGLDLSETRQGAHGVGGLQGMWVTDSQGSRGYSCWYDLNGNLTELVDDSGAIAAHYAYDPYGQVIGEWADTNDSFAVSNAFGFSTKYTDKETGLLYFGRRYYSPTLGRWINRDPIEEAGGYNLYAYGLNDPVNRFDPNGEEPITIGAAIVVVAKFVAVMAAISAAETGVEYLLHDESMGEFNGWAVFGKNFGVNSLTFGAGGKLKLAHKTYRGLRRSGLSARGARYGTYGLGAGASIGLRTFGDSAIDVGRGHGWSESLRRNALGNILGEGLFRGGGALLSRSISRNAPRSGGSLWQSRFPGVQVRQIGNHWVKRVNPDSSRFFQAWGQRTINQQAGALSRLRAAGRPAANSRLTSSGRLIVEDVGTPLSRWNYLRPAYWSARRADARALGGAGRFFNDLRPGNYGAGFRAFDPALDPGVGALGIGGGAAIGGGVLWWTLSGDE